MKRAIILVAVMLTAVLVACSGVALAQPNDDTDDTPAPSQPRGQAAPDTVIVKVEEEASSPRGALEAANRRAGTSTDEQIAPNTLPTLYTVRVPRGLSRGAAIQRLNASPEIEYAEPNFLQFADLTPNDTHYANGTLWGLHNTGQNSGTEDADIDAPTAWDIGTGSTQPVVAVIDTGVDYNHPDLNGNIYNVRGYDFVNNDSDPMDDHNHGTHVAGTIGAVGNNGTGVVGVNWTTKVMACKFLNSSGSGTTANAIKCVDYLTNLKNQGHNIIATNNSWGGGGFSQALLDEINESGQAGLLFVAAAGNGGSDSVGDNNDTTPHYPSSYNATNIIAVASTTRTDAKSGFSNYGSTSVDLGAPGSSIYSTVRGTGYASYSGTSMATPHVAGAVALLKSYSPSATHNEIKDTILRNVDPNSSLAGKTVTGGRLNICRSLGGTADACDPLDTTKPTVTSNSPTGTGVSRRTTVKATFSEQVNGVNGTTFELRDPNNNKVSATVSYDSASRTASLKPSSRLASDRQYTASLSQPITDRANNELDCTSKCSWSFTTG